MGYRIENKTNELLIYDTDTKSINYYPKTDLKVSASEGNVLLTNGNQTIINDDVSKIDLPAFNGLYDLVTTIHGYISTQSPDGFSGGWADYEDVATTGSPIAVTASPTVLTNDGLGVDTNTSYLPVGGNGITQLWDTSSSGS